MVIDESARLVKLWPTNYMRAELQLSPWPVHPDGNGVPSAGAHRDHFPGGGGFNK
jgi:hypothetical protein